MRKDVSSLGNIMKNIRQKEMRLKAMRVAEVRRSSKIVVQLYKTGDDDECA
jgi:hypothetical protein